MSFLKGVINGLLEIWAHKLRSFLTVICVTLGVASLILILGFMNGLFKDYWIMVSESGGVEKISVISDTPPKWQKHISGLSPGQTLTDASLLSKEARHLKTVSPITQFNPAFIQYGKKSRSYRTLGVTQDFFPTNIYAVKKGRNFSDTDLQQSLRVAILGSHVVKKLFGKKVNPIGKQITIEGIPMTVIGILEHYERLAGQYNYLKQKNHIVLIPISTMHHYFTGNNSLSSLDIRINDINNMENAIDEINNILIRSHRGIKDFRINTSEEQLSQVQTMQTNFLLVGGAIGAVTLLVGGIGIMNLMLASINERIREIGIRKSLGAWNSDIFFQFLAESVTLSIFGGLIGILLGVGSIKIFQVIMEEFPPPVFSSLALITGFSFSALVGILAGLYPAFMASRLDPIEALRYE